MTTPGEVLSAICRKGTKLWVHRGSLRYRDVHGMLDQRERRALEYGSRTLLAELIGNTARQTLTYFSNQRREARYAPVTFQQEFALSRLGDTFFDAFSVRLYGRLDVELLADALRVLVSRHEALRTNIVVDNMLLQQEVATFGECRPELVDVGRGSGSVTDCDVQREASNVIDQWLASGAAVFEAKLLKIKNDDHVLMVFWDHLVADYVSAALIFRDLWRLYRDFARMRQQLFSRPVAQYPEYARWQRNAYTAWQEKHGTFWEQTLRDPTALRLPLERTEVLVKRFSQLEILLGHMLSNVLHELAHRVGVSLPLNTAS